jgi:hypothetical protein
MFGWRSVTLNWMVFELTEEKYIYIYIYIYRERERERERDSLITWDKEQCEISHAEQRKLVQTSGPTEPTWHIRHPRSGGIRALNLVDFRNTTVLQKRLISLEILLITSEETSCLNSENFTEDFAEQKPEQSIVWIGLYIYNIGIYVYNIGIYIYIKA